VPPRRHAAPFVVASAGLHVAGAATLLAWPAAWPAVAGALVTDHLGLLAAGLLPRTTLLGANLTRLPPAAAACGEIALTLDDGPDRTVTPRALDLLDQYGARATFFCIGARAERYPDLVREIARRGHRVENHSYAHAHTFAFGLPSRLRRDIEAASELIERLTGRRPVYFRAPAGVRNPLLEGVLQRCGLTLVSWTRRGFDTVSGDPAAITARLLRGLAAGDILLLHDGGNPPAPVLLAALDAVLREAQARGLRLAPLSGG
jgi:peptidoglycan/xylan/chitin deacetylase (PgdA/CDA1 family)